MNINKNIKIVIVSLLIVTFSVSKGMTERQKLITSFVSTIGALAGVPFILKGASGAFSYVSDCSEGIIKDKKGNKLFEGDQFFVRAREGFKRFCLTHAVVNSSLGAVLSYAGYKALNTLMKIYYLKK